MRLIFLCLALLGITVTAQTVVDGCPKNELACHDIMNSSQCIEQIILENSAPLTKENLVKCVEHEGTASNLPGGTKVSSVAAGFELDEKLTSVLQLCRCSGCHTEQLNTVIRQMFPPPCA